MTISQKEIGAWKAFDSRDIFMRLNQLKEQAIKNGADTNLAISFSISQLKSELEEITNIWVDNNVPI